MSRRQATRDALQGRARACQAQRRICISELCHCAEQTTRGTQPIGRIFRKDSWDTACSAYGKCESERTSEVEQTDEGRLSVPQDVFAEENGLPEADHHACRRAGGHTVVRVPCVIFTRLKPTSSGSPQSTATSRRRRRRRRKKKKSSATGGVWHVADNTTGEIRTASGSIIIQDCTDPVKQRSSEHMLRHMEYVTI